MEIHRRRRSWAPQGVRFRDYYQVEYDGSRVDCPSYSALTNNRNLVLSEPNYAKPHGSLEKPFG